MSASSLILIRTKSVCRQRAMPCNATLDGCLHGQTGVGCAPNKPPSPPWCRRRDSTWVKIARSASVARVLYFLMQQCAADPHWVVSTQLYCGQQWILCVSAKGKNSTNRYKNWNRSSSSPRVAQLTTLKTRLCPSPQQNVTLCPRPSTHAEKTFRTRLASHVSDPRSDNNFQMKQDNRRLHFARAVHPFPPIGDAAYRQHAERGPSPGHTQQAQIAKIAREVPEISSPTDRQTDTQTDILITILRNCSRGRSNDLWRRCLAHCLCHIRKSKL